MTDLTLAKTNLDGRTICLCKGGKLIFDDKKGIAPMLGFLSEKVDLKGCSVADLVVGKAAALLFVKAGIIDVYARVLSKSGKKVLEENGVKVEWETLAEKIINRAGDDICPMEKAVETITDPDEAFIVLQKRVSELRAEKNKN